MTIEDALRHTGGFGRWQAKVVILYQCITIFGCFALYPMSFYELQPVYLCKDLLAVEGDETDAEWYTCTVEDFCVMEAEVAYMVDEENSLSLDNWISEYGMTCSPKY